MNLINNFMERLSLEEFILNNHHNIRRNLNTTIDGSIEVKYDNNIFKWHADVREIFKNYNLDKKSIELLSLFISVCDNYAKSTFSSLEMMNNFKTKTIKDIYQKFKDRKIRSKIIGKSYNYHSNKIEYILEDGNYVEIDGDSNKKPCVSFDINIFPLEFLKIIDYNEYRDNKIDKIVN